MAQEEGYGTTTDRWSRRRALRAAALGSAGLAAAAVISCGGEARPGATSAPAVKQPKRGGIVTHAGGRAGSADTQEEPLDPNQLTLTYARTYRLVYQTLVAYDLNTYEVEPELAQRWEQPSPTEYIFSLQPGVKFHNKPPVNGRTLTADDVVYSLNRARTNRPTFTARSLVEGLKIEAIDKAIVKITVGAPDATLLNKLSSDNIVVLAPEVVERVDRLVTPDQVIGTGAFIMTAREENVAAEYGRNPDYWKPGRPYLDGFRTRHFNEEQGAYAAFLAGQIDICRVPGSEAKNYIARQGPDYTPAWFKDDITIMAEPNTRVKPFDDARITRALRLLIDHQECKTAWAEVWFGRGRDASIFPTSLDVWDLTEEEYAKLIFWRQPKDDAVREALALLNAAGYTTSNPLVFDLAASREGRNNAAAVLIQAQWRRLGQGVVDAQMKPFDQTHSPQFNRTFMYGVFGQAGGFNDPDAWLTQIYRTNGSRNDTGFSDPKVDAWIDRQRTIFDLQQRRAAVREIVVYLAEHFPGVVPSARYLLNAVKRQIRDYAPEFWLQGRQYEWVWLDV